MNFTMPADAPIGTPLEAANPDLPFGAAKTFPSEVNAAAPAEPSVQPFNDEIPDGEEASEQPAGQEAAETNPLIEEAGRYGFTPEQAAALGDNLESVIVQMDRQAIALMRQQAEAQPPTQPTEPTPPVEPPKAPQATQPVAPVEAPKFEKLDVKSLIDPNDYDEPLVKTLTALVDRINVAGEAATSQNQTVVQQQQTIEKLTQATRQLATMLLEADTQTQEADYSTFAETMDGVFTKLGPEFADVFGATPMASLTNQSHVAARNKVVDEIRFLKAADQQHGRKVVSDSEYAQRVIRVQHQDKLAAAARRGVNEQLMAQRKKSIAQPTGRITRGTNKRANAEAAVAEMLAGMGLPNN